MVFSFIFPKDLTAIISNGSISTLSRRLNSYNCEFYPRPEVAISEFPETVIQNTEYLEKNADFLDMTSLNAFIK